MADDGGVEEGAVEEVGGVGAGVEGRQDKGNRSESFESGRIERLVIDSENPAMGPS